jgi:hypothetical protein
MTEEDGPSAPTPTALAARDFLKRVDNPAYRRIIETRAVLGGWAGARGAGCWDAHLSDAIAKAAVNAVLELFRKWAAECAGEAEAITHGEPGLTQDDWLMILDRLDGASRCAYCDPCDQEEKPRIARLRAFLASRGFIAEVPD